MAVEPKLAGKALRLGITGARGFLGWHMRCRVLSEPAIEVVCADRETFADSGALREFAESCDTILHCAGVNRGTDEEVAELNPGLAAQLAGALDSCASKATVIYASTTHEAGTSLYGRAKRAAGDILQASAEWRGATFTRLILPHLFGESGKPFYNSVVATFCHQIATGGTPVVTTDAELELLHAQRVADEVVTLLGKPHPGERRLEGHAMRVSELLRRLENLSGSYAAHLVPGLAAPIDLQLFNAYRSYLFPQAYPVSLELHSDPRGTLFEAVKSVGGGQTFLSTTRPGITRGNHYHRAKVERFLVVQGTATIRVRRLFDESASVFTVSGDTPQYVDMPALHTHNITNTGTDDVMTLFWANEVFDPACPDTYAEMV